MRDALVPEVDLPGLCLVLVLWGRVGCGELVGCGEGPYKVIQARRVSRQNSNQSPSPSPSTYARTSSPKSPVPAWSWGCWCKSVRRNVVPAFCSPIMRKSGKLAEFCPSAEGT
jgi:hypothetical protein